eukprot:Hpha_TRINITY_DN3257_c0_g1::TRINITY_DN3257_c0_g1_i1::g.185850::m.185850
MTDLIEKLQRLSAISKVCQELDTHLGADPGNRDLAEYFIDLVHRSGSFKDFQQKVRADADDFGDDLLRSLYSKVMQMLPPGGFAIEIKDPPAAAAPSPPPPL